ncbi:MAG: mannose-1-phosphate guanylyltransferase [Phycisphaerae bacterium]|nr:MAG: mannose-1-phosphate guanylyltransferase [Phycisphaerae bacterium]
MRHAVIMAGGAGTRLWPLSRRHRPKQLLKIIGGTSLLRSSFERLRETFPPERIYVITGEKYLPLVANELPEVPSQNLFGEPQGRDTANAVGLASAIIDQRDKNAVVGVFTADHLIAPLEKFTKCVQLAFETVENEADALVTFGITVRSAETAFGYIRKGDEVSPGVFRVKKFTEKPDPIRAQRYAESGDYFWNSGMFAWRASTILDELEQNLPVTHKGVLEIARDWDTPKRPEKLSEIYPKLQKISIDFAVMERARDVFVVEMNCEWADVGSWAQLSTVLDSDSRDNVTVANSAVHLGSEGVTVVSEDDDHLIATLGLKDLVIVHSRDATMVCKKRDAQALRELLANIEAKFGDKYL